MYRIDFEDMVLKYRVEGETGPLLFFFHGFGGHPQNWLPLIETLSGRFRCVVANVKPFFTSKEVISLERQTEIVTSFVQQVKAEYYESEAFSISSSYGSMLVVLAQSEDNSLFSRNIFLSPMPTAPLDKLRYKPLRWVMSLANIPFVLLSFLNSSVGYKAIVYVGRAFHIRVARKRRFTNFNKRKVNILFKAIKRFIDIDDKNDWDQLEDKINDYNCPTMVFYATRDKLFFPDDFESLCVQLKVEWVYPVSSGSHFLMLSEVDKVASKVESFLYSDSLIYKKQA